MAKVHHRPSGADLSALNKLRKRSIAAAAARSYKTELTTDQIEKVRNATKTKFEELLSEPHLESVKSPIKSPNEVATEIECAIYLKHLNIDRNYKSDFRRLVISLKDRKTQFIELLLDGKIEGTKFANLSSQELMSVDLRQNIETIKQENIRLSTLQESLPEDISAFKDGRDREKWGVEKSAAALDG